MVLRRFCVVTLALALAGGCKKASEERSPIEQAHALAAGGRKQEAVKVLEAALAKSSDPALALALANLEESLYHFGRARQWFAQARADKRLTLAALHGLARMAWKEDELATARKHLEEIPRLHPNPLVAATLAAPLARTPDESRAVLARLETLRKQNPGFWADAAESLAALADAQAMAGDGAAADATLTRLRSARANDLSNALLLADLYRLSGRPWPALALTHAVLRTEAKAGEAWIELALVASDVKDFGVADQALGRIPARVESDAELLMVRARVDRAHGRMASALRSAEQAVALVPPSEPYHRRVRLALVELLMQLNQMGRARHEVDRILQQDPAWVPAYVASAALSIEEKKPDQALAALGALDDRGPRGRRVLELRGAALLAQGDLAGAERTFRRVVEQAPTDPTGPLLVGMVLVKRGDTPGARREWVRAMQLAPGDASLVERVIDLDRKAGRRESPVPMVREQLRRAPDSPALLELFARLLQAEGAVGEAERQYRQALRLAPGRTGTWLGLAGLFRSVGRHQDRLEALKKAEALAPESLPIHLDRADAERRAGNPQKAAEIYEAVLAKHPQSPAILNNLALVYAGPLQQPARGLALAEKARAQAPDEPRLADTLGWIHWLSGKPERALPLLREAAAKLEDPDVHFHLGVALVKTGDRAQGTARLRKALALSPTFEGADEARRLLDEKERRE